LTSKSSYNRILKATTLFGGVQVINIITAIIRSKAMALLLGPAGFGVFGLLNSTVLFISAATNFGLGISSVKNVAEAHSTGNHDRVTLVINVLWRWTWLTGIIGVVLTILLSPVLSDLVFDDPNHTFSFVLISIVLLLMQLNVANKVILQGLQKLSLLAKASLLGNILSLFFTIPLYYFFAAKGIVPAIIITAVLAFLCSRYFAKQLDIKRIPVSRVILISEGKDMLSMGALISFGAMITIGGSFLLRIFINYIGNASEVGLYDAGYTIVNTYVSMIFIAMGTDYYPRLSAVGNDNKACKQLINQQAEVGILILAPIINLFLVFIYWVILILYSSDFLAINNMIHWAAMGMFFKVVSWSAGFVFLAKGASRIFFWNELISSIYILLLNILGYYYYGLTGLGVSFMLGFVLHAIQISIVCYHYYDFAFTDSFISVFFRQFLLSICCFLTVSFVVAPYSYLLGVLIICISIWISYRQLDSYVDIPNLLRTFNKRK